MKEGRLSCDNCAFSKEVPDQETFGMLTRLLALQRKGELFNCRIRAPIHPERWPMVAGYDWCGEHKEKLK